MRFRSRWALAVLAALLPFGCVSPTPAIAQTVTLPQVHNQAGQNIGSGAAVLTDSTGAEKGIPGNPVYVAPPAAAPATSTPLTIAVSTTGAQTIGPMAPQLAREVWGTLSATGATGTVQILRSTDGGNTKLALTQAGYIGQNTVLSGSTSPAVAYSWTLSNFTGLLVNEPLFTPTDTGTYFVVVNLTGGSVSGRLSQ